MKHIGLILILLLLAIPIVSLSTLNPLAIIYHQEYQINGDSVQSGDQLTIQGYSIEASVIWNPEILGDSDQEPEPTSWSYRVMVQPGYWRERVSGWGPDQLWSWKDEGTSFNLVRGSPDEAGSVEHKATIDLRDSWDPDFEPNTFKITFYRTWGDSERKGARVYLTVGEIPDEPPPDEDGLTDTDPWGDDSPVGENGDYEYDPAWGVKLPLLATVGIVGAVMVLMYRKR